MEKKQEWGFRELKYVTTWVEFDQPLTEDEALERYNSGDFHWSCAYEQTGDTFDLISVS